MYFLKRFTVSELRAASSHDAPAGGDPDLAAAALPRRNRNFQREFRKAMARSLIASGGVSIISVAEPEVLQQAYLQLRREGFRQEGWPKPQNATRFDEECESDDFDDMSYGFLVCEKKSKEPYAVMRVIVNNPGSSQASRILEESGSTDTLSRELLNSYARHNTATTLAEFVCHSFALRPLQISLSRLFSLKERRDRLAVPPDCL